MGKTVNLEICKRLESREKGLKQNPCKPKLPREAGKGNNRRMGKKGKGTVNWGSRVENPEIRKMMRGTKAIQVSPNPSALEEANTCAPGAFQPPSPCRLLVVLYGPGARWFARDPCGTSNNSPTNRQACALSPVVAATI